MAARPPAPEAPPAPVAGPVTAAETAAYVAATEAALAPLVRLLIGKGVGYPVVDQLLQRAYVQQALDWFVPAGEPPTASRLYMLTGIHRKKIAPLLEAPPPQAQARDKPISMQVLELLSGEPRLMDSRGRHKPFALSRREGGELSFEAMVERISKDVRARAVLDQMVQAGIVRVDQQGRGRITLGESSRASYVPGQQAETFNRMLRPLLELLANNILGGGERARNFNVQVSGLKPETATALRQEFYRELVDLMMRFNQRAERHAVSDRQAGGRCTITAVGFEWVDGLPATARPVPAAVTPRRGPGPGLQRALRQRADQAAAEPVPPAAPAPRSAKAARSKR